jgi:hypothetical protein
MLKALAIFSLKFAFLTFGIWAISWAVLIREVGFSESVRRAIHLSPGNLVHVIVVAVGMMFLLVGLNLLGQADGDGDR